MKIDLKITKKQAENKWHNKTGCSIE